MKQRKRKFIRLNGSVKESLEISRNRIFIIAFVFCLSFFAISARLVDLSIASEARSSNYLGAIDADTRVKVARGEIIDRNGVILATNLKTASLYANPKVIIDAASAVEELSTLFPDLDRLVLLEQLSVDKEFVWIKRKLHPKEQLAVNNLGIPGLEFRLEEKRTYPHGNLVSHLVGTVGVDGNGLTGIEKSFDDRLLSDNFGESPLQLSIDVRVQDILHNKLLKSYKEFKAKTAAGIVMDVKTGEVIAMVSLPDFDPNDLKNTKKRNLFNMATLGVYEMGSTFKPFTMAMALENNIIKMTDSYDATKPLKMGKYRISDYHAKKRRLTVPEIFMYSSNIGTAKIADDVGSDIQKSFLKKLALFDILPLEISELGTPQIPYNWRRLSTMTVSYGHGISVTPMHVVSAISSIVNGGIYKDPTFLKKSGDDSEGRRVISKKTSETMRKLLRLVVTGGSGKKADAKGYFVGGKTGTADKVGEKNRYNKKARLSSFVGAFPINDPKYVVLAILDEPKGNKRTWNFATGGWTAAPVVGEVISSIAPVLGIKPVDENSKKIKKAFYINYELKGKKLASF